MCAPLQLFTAHNSFQIEPTEDNNSVGGVNICTGRMHMCLDLNTD